MEFRTAEVFRLVKSGLDQRSSIPIHRKNICEQPLNRRTLNNKFTSDKDVFGCSQCVCPPERCRFMLYLSGEMRVTNLNEFPHPLTSLYRFLISFLDFHLLFHPVLSVCFRTSVLNKIIDSSNSMSVTSLIFCLLFASDLPQKQRQHQ